MKREISALFLFAAISGVAHAQTDVFLCVDDQGKTEYKNVGATKGCKKVELPGLTVVSPTKKTGKSGGGESTTVAKSSPSPSDFPKVDNDTQKVRDNDRKQILLNEMKAEEQKLANLKKEYSNGEPPRNGDERNYAKYQERVASLKEDIARSEKNVEALQRELGNLK
jgi:hypothetical protein